MDAAVPTMAAALAALAPPGVRTGCRRVVADDLATLHDVEAAAIARAVTARRHEFASGRALLRSLLGTDVALAVRTDRAPQLPSGWVGSLAHTHGIAVAAVAPYDVAAALGVDVEPTTPLGIEMADVILRADERALDAHLAFTLKEAVYKAWSRLGGGMLEHHDVRVRAAPDGRFDGRVLPADAAFAGRWREVAEHWVALVVVPAVHRPGPVGGL